jgi:hypothetical protein
MRWGGGLIEFGRYQREFDEAARLEETTIRDESQAQAIRADTAPEHRTRRDLIDPTLEALGWDLSRFSDSMVQEARLRGGETVLFADYLGVDARDASPAVLVEAKPFDVSPPSPIGGWPRHALGPNREIDLVRSAISHLQNPTTDAPVNQTWVGWLGKLREYVALANARNEQPLKAAAITSGRWWIVFDDPDKTLFGDGGEIQFFKFADLREESFFHSMARRGFLPRPSTPIEVSQLPSFCSPNEVRWVGVGNRISTANDAWGQFQRPRQRVGPAVVLRLHDDTCIRVIGDAEADDVLPYGFDQFPDHRQRVKRQTDELLSQVNRWLGYSASPGDLAQFKGGSASREREMEWRRRGSDRAVILTLGQSDHYLRPDPSYANCTRHHVANSARAGDAPDVGVFAPSNEPPVYFPSGHSFHCSSRHVALAKQDRCLIGYFEHAVCCQMCAYRNVCWSAVELSRLPCNPG